VDLLTNPIIVLVLALLGLPMVTSAITGLLKRVSVDTGIGPKVFVYIASLAVTGLVLATSGAGFPEWAGDPAAFTAAWLAWTTVNAELARRVYELLFERVYQPD